MEFRGHNSNCISMRYNHDNKHCVRGTRRGCKNFGGVPVRNLYIGLLILCGCSFVVCGQSIGSHGVKDVVSQVEAAIIKRDVGKLMQYVSSRGTYFIDDYYSYNEIRELLGDKKSWLYKHLFVGESSVFHYFKSNSMIRERIHMRGKNAVSVVFESASSLPANWIECCFIEIKGRWYFDGIFSCE